MSTHECAFYFDYEHSIYDCCLLDGDIKYIFDKYFDKYVAGLEVSKSGVKHLQCWALGKTKSSYTNFMQAIVKKLKLNGRATKGVRKQYGRIKGVIKDTDNMISYCLKENKNAKRRDPGNIGYWSRGLEESYLKERIQASYMHERTPKEKFQEFVDKAKDAIFETTQYEPFEHPHETHQRLLKQCTIISQVYQETYESIIPKTAVDKTLLALGLIDHKRIAQDRFFTYIGAPQTCPTYLETNEIIEL